MSTTDKELLLRKYNIVKINKKEQSQHKISFKLKKSEQVINVP